MLEIETAQPGDFSIYTLHIDSDRLDPFFNDIEFSLQAGVPEPVRLPAKGSALSRRGAGRFPGRLSRSRFHEYSPRAARFRRATLPQLAGAARSRRGRDALGDHGRAGRRVFLSSGSPRARVPFSERDATAFASLAHVAGRLSDSRRAFGHDAAVDRGLGQWRHFIDAGTRVWGRADDGSAIPFEIGDGLRDTRRFWVHQDWNAIPAHLPDDAVPCLPIGSTEIFLRDHFPLPAQQPNPADVR